MKKRRRARTGEAQEPLSAGRVEYLEQARARVRSRRLRRTAAVVVLLAAAVAFATGLVGESVAAAKDLADSAVIALAPDAGWPQNIGIDEVLQVQPLSGGFVALGADSCAVYAAGGNRVNAVQSGYARPALAAGKTRYVLYNRSGNELRVESRTQNLYTKTTENSIYLCAMAADGKLAVVTDAVRSAAALTVYSASMDQLLQWELTSAEGVPLRLAFSPDSRSLAVAAVTANGGQMACNLYVLPLGQGDAVTVGTQIGTPEYLSWLSGNVLLAVYDTRAVLYNATGGERAAWDFGGRTLADVSVDAHGNVALLFENGPTCEAAALNAALSVQFCGAVPSAEHIVRSGDTFYLLTESGIECFGEAGGWQWSLPLAVRAQALLEQNGQLLAFCGNTVQPVQPPEQESASASAAE